MAVVQPARVQDVERHAAHILPKSVVDSLAPGSLRIAHEEARQAALVWSLRKGVYVLSREAWSLVRVRGLQPELDNRRIFLIKSQRRRFMSLSGTE